MYLWKSPTYREIFQRTSVEEADIYSRFNFLLETDATYILDEALKMLQEVREYEKLPDSQRTRESDDAHSKKGAPLLLSCSPPPC